MFNLELYFWLVVERRYLSVALSKLNSMAFGKLLCLFHSSIVVNAVQLH
jgi:hypothetical protein